MAKPPPLPFAPGNTPPRLAPDALPDMSLRPRDALEPGPEAIRATLGALNTSSVLARSLFDQATVVTGGGLNNRPGDGPGGGLNNRPGDGGAPARSHTPVEEIGRGGMGVVYRARQAVLHRDIAIKVASFDGNEERAPAFISEALVTAGLEHPNIVPVYDLTTTPDQRLALAMKLIGGATWNDLLHPRTPEHEARAREADLSFHLDVLLTVGNALAFAHSKHIIHCDIKPANVLIGEFGEILLVDWGIAFDCRPEKSTDSPAPHCSDLASPCGTPQYMAPELALGNGPALGPWTDVFLLGAVLYEILTGRPPHDGEATAQVLWQAVEWRGPDFSGFDEARVPPALAAICARAMAQQPGDRYASVSAMQADLHAFLDHRQSLLISQRAHDMLESCIERGRQPGHMRDQGGRNILYSDFADAVAGFREARVLWADNPRAIEGEERARMAFARTALEQQDLGLAEAQLEHLDGAEAEVAELVARVQAAQDARSRARKLTRRLSLALAVTALVIIAGLAVAYVLIEREHRVAETRLADIRRLSDAHRLRDLEQQYDELWPATPETAGAMTEWLADARALVQRLPAHRHYAETLAEHAQKTAEGVVFEQLEDRWEYDNLTQLTASLERVEAIMMPAMNERLAFATSVYRRSIEEHADAWAEARAQVASSPLYAGLELEPQLGLVPLGPDPETGLWEFAHIQSGAVPKRGGNDGRGALVLTEDMGIVLVLLPGGRFRMGAEPPSNEHPPGSDNVDPEAREPEGPVHEVRLDAFFFAKYEMTQGQWQRFTGQNPSAYPPGTVIGGKVHTALHPVELITWKESKRVMDNLGLTLPSEAQWEYAARGGSRTVYPTGDAKTSLQGALNIADRYCKEHGGPGSWHYETWLDDGYVVHAPVGRYRANGFGLHDVVGNVWEWCMDRYSPYSAALEPGTGERIAAEDTPRVFRGGGFRASAVHARSADRYSLYAPDYRGYDIGLRPARLLASAPRP